MVRTIKKVTHDLMPLSDAVTELSALISELLKAVEPHVRFENDKAAKYFDDSVKASGNLAVSAKLIKDYLHEVDGEADREGITKD